jgi:hypothetical protein
VNDDRGVRCGWSEVTQENTTMATPFQTDVCNQFRHDTCGHCWACAMRRGLEDLFGHTDYCGSTDLVNELLDAIQSLRQVDKSAERGESQHHAVSEAAKTITNMVVDIHGFVSTE